MMTPEDEQTLTAGLFIGQFIAAYVLFAWISGIFEEDRRRAENDTLREKAMRAAQVEAKVK